MTALPELLHSLAHDRWPPDGPTPGRDDGPVEGLRAAIQSQRKNDPALFDALRSTRDRLIAESQTDPTPLSVFVTALNIIGPERHPPNLMIPILEQPARFGDLQGVSGSLYLQAWKTWMKAAEPEEVFRKLLLLFNYPAGREIMLLAWRRLAPDMLLDKLNSLASELSEDEIKTTVRFFLIGDLVARGRELRNRLIQERGWSLTLRSILGDVLDELSPVPWRQSGQTAGKHSGVPRFGTKASNKSVTESHP